MSSYLILDSNTNYAQRLHKALTGTSSNAARNVIDTGKEKDLFDLSRRIAERVNKKTILLINAEGVLAGGVRQHQQLVDIALWLRTKHRLENPIVFYSLQSVNQLLSVRPESFILLSPGCSHLRLPISTDEFKQISNAKRLSGSDSIRPYLRPRLDIEQTRHRYANYAGMAFMLDVAKQVWEVSVDSKILRGTPATLAPFFRFRKSLDSALLANYFDIDRDLKMDRNNRASLKLNKRLPKYGTLLLVDDLADNGWKAILSQMFCGKPSDPRITSLPVLTELQAGRILFDFNRTKNALAIEIERSKPHLILLDLRLNDEEGRQSLDQLGGFQLLNAIKGHARFKGLPVIMFTASGKAETSKELIAAGAEAVWTKPGIDERLNSEGILARYAELMRVVHDSINPNYQVLNQIDDNTQPQFDISQVDFSAIRNLLFKKLEFIKYRLRLYSHLELEKLTPPPYSSADAIYIDSNVLVKGDRRIRFQDIISAVYKLSILTNNSVCAFVARGVNAPQVLFPKVVVMNAVFDEVIKLAKTEKYEPLQGSRTRNSLLFMRASLSQLIVKDMFANNFIRTEFDRNTKIATPKLKAPKESTYADGYLLDEIADLTVTHSANAFRYLPTTSVIVVTGDAKLRDKLSRFNQVNSVVIKSRENLIRDMSTVVV